MGSMRFAPSMREAHGASHIVDLERIRQRSLAGAKGKGGVWRRGAI